MSDNLSSLVVRIDKELHKQIKAACAIDDMSIREYITNLIKKDMQNRNEQNKEKR